MPHPLSSIKITLIKRRTGDRRAFSPSFCGAMHLKLKRRPSIFGMTQGRGDQRREH
jgi:hypothetical protein